MSQFLSIIQQDPAVDTEEGFTGGGQTNGGFAFIALKPRNERKDSADQVIARLRRGFERVPGASLFLQSVQDIRVGGRQSNAQFQFTLQADDLDTLYNWAPKIATALQSVPEMTDVNSDQQQKGLETDLLIDRPRPRGSASRQARSTTRSMTPSASARCRRSTTRSTSITS